MNSFRHLYANNFPGPIIGKIYVPEFGDKAYITACVTEELNALPLRELCDTNGNFPEKIIVNAAGRPMRVEKTRSKMPVKSLYTYIVDHFDISLLSAEQKGWFEEVVKNKLAEISKQVKKANAPKKTKKDSTKKPLTDAESKQQKKLKKIVKVVEHAKSENLSAK